MISRRGILCNGSVLYAPRIRSFVVQMQGLASGRCSSQDATFVVICSSARLDQIGSNCLPMHISVTRKPLFTYALKTCFMDVTRVLDFMPPICSLVMKQIFFEIVIMNSILFACVMSADKMTFL